MINMIYDSSTLKFKSLLLTLVPLNKASQNSYHQWTSLLVVFLRGIQIELKEADEHVVDAGALFQD